MHSLPRRFGDWVVSHPIVWGVGVGVLLVLLDFALDLAPMAVLAAGTAIGVLNIVHAHRRGCCPRPAESGAQAGRASPGDVPVGPSGIDHQVWDVMRPCALLPR